MSNKIPFEASNKSIQLYKVISHLQKMREDVRELKSLLGNASFDNDSQRLLIHKWFLLFGKQEFGVAERLLEMEDDMLKVWAEQHEHNFHGGNFGS